MEEEMRIIGSQAEFDTGTAKYAEGGVIGLGPDGNVFDGHSGLFWGGVESGDRAPLTPEECAELGEYMARRWRNWAVQNGPKPEKGLTAY